MKNYQEIKIQILEFIVGGKSTSWISRKLGYKHDKVKRWNNGTKQLRWNEFCDLCLALEVPLAQALRSTLGILVPTQVELYRIVYHLQIFSQSKTVRDLAGQIQISTATLSRYTSAEIFPDLELVLAMIDLKPYFLPHFVETLIHPVRGAKASVLAIPWAGAVVNTMKISSEFRNVHDAPERIALFLGLSVTQVNEAIQFMVDQDLIEAVNSVYGPTRQRTLAFSGKIEPEEYNRFVKYWYLRAHKRKSLNLEINAINKDPWTKDGFRIFAASEEATQVISEILVKAEQQIHEILSRDEKPPTDVRVALFSHFSAQDF